MLSPGGVSARRGGAGTKGSGRARRGDVLVSQAQRSRLLTAAAQVVSEHGYAELSVARITEGAGMSRRTFYDLFRDCEDCFLAVFEDTVLRAREAIAAGLQSEGQWHEQVREALLAVLVLLDSEPQVGALLLTDALKAGPRVQERRVEILQELSLALHRVGSRARPGVELPSLIGEGLIGAVLSVIHTRLLERRRGPFTVLLNPLTGMIVLPYAGPAAARRELDRPAAKVARRSTAAARRMTPTGAALAGLPVRITYRTVMVLTVIDRTPGASNRRIAEESGVSDQGQMSKLLARLQGLGLIENTSPGQPSGEPNRWQLTSHGRRVVRAFAAPAAPGGGGGRTA